MSLPLPMSLTTTAGLSLPGNRLYQACCGSGPLQVTLQRPPTAADRCCSLPPTVASAGRRVCADRCLRRPPTAAGGCQPPLLAAAGRGPLPAACCWRGLWAILELPQRPESPDLRRACGGGCCCEPAAVAAIGSRRQPLLPPAAYHGRQPPPASAVCCGPPDAERWSMLELPWLRACGRQTSGRQLHASH